MGVFTLRTAAVLTLAFAGASSSCIDLGGEGSGDNTEVRTSGDGIGGFLWKPVSEGDGKLVILFPTDISPTVVSGEVHRSFPPKASTLMEAGNLAYRSANGNRAHFRFTRSGGAYGNNVYAVAVMPDGRKIGFPIPTGAARID